jgi:hypothetical protein
MASEHPDYFRHLFEVSWMRIRENESANSFLLNKFLLE